MAIRVQAKEVENPVTRIWKETEKRTAERAQRLEKLKNMFSDAEGKHQKAEEAYRTAVESLDAEKVIRSRRDRDEAFELMEMYRQAIEKTEEESIYTGEELEQIKADLKMYASNIIEERGLTIGEALENLKELVSQSREELKSVNDLYKHILTPDAFIKAEIKPTGFEQNIIGSIIDLKTRFPQYFKKPVVRNGSGHVIDV